MSLGKWTNAFVAGTNENNLSLANINLDFSLVKVTVPDEFLPLGRAMSLQRRQTAEEGPVHQTARRLGALFSHIAPKPPNLSRHSVKEFQRSCKRQEQVHKARQHMALFETSWAPTRPQSGPLQRRDLPL